MLEGKPEGTFLFRFSTSHLGLLSISFVGKASRPSSSSQDASGDAAGASAAITPAPQAKAGGGATGGKKSSGAKSAQVRHFLVQVEDDGRCVVFMEPGRQRHESLQHLVMHSSSLLQFYPNIEKKKAFQELNSRFH